MNRNEPIKATPNIFQMEDDIEPVPMNSGNFNGYGSTIKKKAQARKEVQEIENISTIRTDKVEGGMNYSQQNQQQVNQ